MDTERIKNTVNSGLPKEVVEREIIRILSEDEDVVNSIILILGAERDSNKRLISDSNLELSRALVVLSDKNLKWNKKIIADPAWVVGEVKKHYLKWKDFVKCGFKVDGLP